jgi:hypothetical protein
VVDKATIDLVLGKCESSRKLSLFVGSTRQKGLVLSSANGTEGASKNTKVEVGGSFPIEYIILEPTRSEGSSTDKTPSKGGRGYVSLGEHQGEKPIPNPSVTNPGRKPESSTFFKRRSQKYLKIS